TDERGVATTERSFSRFDTIDRPAHRPHDDTELLVGRARSATAQTRSDRFGQLVNVDGFPVVAAAVRKARIGVGLQLRVAHARALVDKGILIPPKPFEFLLTNVGIADVRAGDTETDLATKVGTLRIIRYLSEVRRQHDLVRRISLVRGELRKEFL